MSSNNLLTSTGISVRLGSVLGRGAEGIVREVEGVPDRAAKIFLPGKAKVRHDKIVAMIAARWHSTSNFVAFPIEALFDPSTKAFAGFTMRKAAGHRPVHQLYSPTDRKSKFPSAQYPLLVRAAANMARAMASVHSENCVVGDVNHSGILVAQDATVTLIDSDSFQFTAQGRIFSCEMGVPEFTPPELQGKRFDQILRTRDHDAFGLAVLIFYTLFMGRHPFAGRFSGASEMQPPRAIHEFRFAYSNDRAATTQMGPPPNVPTLADLPKPLADAFERAFGPSGVNAGVRPAAGEWAALLEGSEAELVRCGHSASHHYFRSARDCPWCRMERANPGFAAFGATLQAPVAGQPLDLVQFIAALQGTPDPGQAPPLASLMPQTAPPPGPPALKARRDKLTRWLGGVAGVGLAVFLLTLADAIHLAGVPLLIGSIVFALGTPTSCATVQNAVGRTQSAWKAAEEAFRLAAGNMEFLGARRTAEGLLQQLRDLPGEEVRRIASLTARKRELQLRTFLEQFKINDAKISGIGYSRKLTLISFGIETAADVDSRRVESLPGFGSSLSGSLLSWRRSIEGTFTFNPNIAVNPQDIAIIKADVSRLRSDLEGRIKPAIAAMQKAARDVKALRASPTPEALSTWAAQKQAQTDNQALATAGKDFGKYVGGVAAVLIVFAISAQGLRAHFSRSGSNLDRPITATQKDVSSTPTAGGKATPETQPNPQLPAQRTSPLSVSGVVPPASPTARRVPPASGPSMPPAAPAPPQVSAPPVGGTRPAYPQQMMGPTAGPLSPAAPLVAPGPSLPPLPEQTEVVGSRIMGQALPSPSAPLQMPTGALLNLLIPDEAALLQQRLVELGYLNGTADGIWGPYSRTALRDFRAANGIGVDDLWDRTTQSALFSSGARRRGAVPIFPLSNQPLTAETPIQPPPGATRTPLNRSDAAWIQSRLRELGFYNANGDGIWGRASRDALRDFKFVNGLPQDDVWDALAEVRLSAASAIRAQTSFLGGYSDGVTGCASGPNGADPVTISSRRAEAAGGICEFDEVLMAGPDRWRIKARCFVGGQTWTSNVLLIKTGSALTWTSERGSARYQRCP